MKMPVIALRFIAKSARRVREVILLIDLTGWVRINQMRIQYPAIAICIQKLWRVSLGVPSPLKGMNPVNDSATPAVKLTTGAY